MSLCSQHTKVCRNAGDVRTFLSQQQVIDVSSSLSWGRWRCVFCSLIEVNLMFSTSRQVLRWDSATTVFSMTPQSGTELLPPGWWCLDACRVYLQNVNLPAVLTSAPLIMCGISLGVLVMFNVKLIDSTNKPNKQLPLVEQQQLFGVGKEDLVFLYCSGGSIHTLSFAGYQRMHASYFRKYG